MLCQQRDINQQYALVSAINYEPACRNAVMQDYVVLSPGKLLPVRLSLRVELHLQERLFLFVVPWHERHFFGAGA